METYGQKEEREDACGSAEDEGTKKIEVNQKTAERS